MSATALACAAHNSDSEPSPTTGIFAAVQPGQTRPLQTKIESLQPETSKVVDRPPGTTGVVIGPRLSVVEAVIPPKTESTTCEVNADQRFLAIPNCIVLIVRLVREPVGLIIEPSNPAPLPEQGTLLLRLTLADPTGVAIVAATQSDTAADWVQFMHCLISKRAPKFISEELRALTGVTLSDDTVSLVVAEALRLHSKAIGFDTIDCDALSSDA